MKRREDGTEYRMLREEGTRVTRRAVNLKTVDRATVLPTSISIWLTVRGAIQMWRMLCISRTMKTGYSTS